MHIVHRSHVSQTAEEHHKNFPTSNLSNPTFNNSLDIITGDDLSHNLPGLPGNPGANGGMGFCGTDGLLGPQGDNRLPGMNVMTINCERTGLAGLKVIPGKKAQAGTPGEVAKDDPKGESVCGGAQLGQRGEPVFPGLEGRDGNDGLQGYKGPKSGMVQGIPGLRGPCVCQGCDGFQNLEGFPGQKGATG